MGSAYDGLSSRAHTANATGRALRNRWCSSGRWNASATAATGGVVALRAQKQSSRYLDLPLGCRKRWPPTASFRSPPNVR